MRERKAARELSAEIDRLLAGGELRTPHAPLLRTARRLSGMSARLPPVPPDLERRVRANAEAASGRPRERGGWLQLRPALWGALAATVVLLALSFILPQGQQAWAGMAHAILGQTRVELTPDVGPELRSVREPVRDLVAAELIMGRAPALPGSLPQGYDLQDIAAVSYPDLPAWISQPLFVELCYGPSGETPGLRLREYRLLLKEGGRVGGVQVAGDAVLEFEPVDVAGASGTLLTLSGDDLSSARETYTVLWERDGMLLELESDCMTKEALLQIALTVR